MSRIDHVYVDHVVANNSHCIIVINSFIIRSLYFIYPQKRSYLNLNYKLHI